MSYKPLPDNLTIKESPIINKLFTNSYIIDNNISCISCIYAIKYDEKFYIGSTNCLEERIKKHKLELRKLRHYNKYLQNIYNKYGMDIFKFYVLEEITCDSMLLKTEQLCINILLNNNVKLLNHVISNIDNKEFNKSSLKRGVSCYTLDGFLYKNFKDAKDAAKHFKINAGSIRDCCRKRQKVTNNFIFIFEDDLISSKEIQENPYKYIQYGNINNNRCNNKKINSSYREGLKENIHIEVYDFKSRVKLGYYTNIKQVADIYNISTDSIRRNIVNDTFIINDYIIRASKIKKDVLPQGYYYRPLQPGLTIEKDVFDELRIVTKFKILKGATLGISHIKLPTNELLRCEMGGFINTSKTPNCTLIETKKDSIIAEYILTAIKDISAGSEITLDYTKELCGLTGYTEEEWLKI